MDELINSYQFHSMEKKLLQEMEHIRRGWADQNVGLGLRIKGFWNISRHKLYRVQRCDSMKAFAETTGYSYRWVLHLIKQGDMLADLLLKDVPEEERWLTEDHVKLFVSASIEAKMIEARDPLLLTDGRANDTNCLVHEEDDTKRLARFIAKRKAEKKPKEVLHPHREHIRGAKRAGMHAEAKAFIAKWERKTGLDLQVVLSAVMDGGAAMTKEWKGLNPSAIVDVLEYCYDVILKLKLRLSSGGCDEEE